MNNLWKVNTMSFEVSRLLKRLSIEDILSYEKDLQKELNDLARGLADNPGTRFGEDTYIGKKQMLSEVQSQINMNKTKEVYVNQTGKP